MYATIENILLAEMILWPIIRHICDKVTILKAKCCIRHDTETLFLSFLCKLDHFVSVNGLAAIAHKTIQTKQRSNKIGQWAQVVTSHCKANRIIKYTLTS